METSQTHVAAQLPRQSSSISTPITPFRWLLSAKVAPPSDQSTFYLQMRRTCSAAQPFQNAGSLTSVYRDLRNTLRLECRHATVTDDYYGVRTGFSKMANIKILLSHLNPTACNFIHASWGQSLLFVEIVTDGCNADNFLAFYMPRFLGCLN